MKFIGMLVERITTKNIENLMQYRSNLTLSRKFQLLTVPTEAIYIYSTYTITT